MFTTILARSGSKGVPNKNIRELNNIPMSHYAAKAAIESGVCDRIVYSSDSVYYLQLFKERIIWANKRNDIQIIPHLRPQNLSGDYVSSWEVIKFLANEFQLEKSEQVLLISATCPMVTGDMVQQFVQNCSDHSQAMTTREVDYPIQNTFYQSSDSKVSYHQMTQFVKSRQMATEIFRPDGYMFLREVSDLLEDKIFPNENCKCHDLKCGNYVNVDTEADFELARALMDSK